MDMGSSGDPSVLAMVIAFVCAAPWFLLLFLAWADKFPTKPPKNEIGAYNEIRERNLSMTDERAGFVQAKLEKIERASR